MSKQGKRALVSELRFPEFRGEPEWEAKPFEDVFKRLTAKNVGNNENVLTISAQMGLVSQLEYFNKKVAAKNLTGYYLLHKGDFAYNKSYSHGYPMGAIKRLNIYDKGVVSTLYICFRVKDGYNGSFFEQYFESGITNSEIGKIAQEGGRAHGLLNVSVKEFFKDVSLHVPRWEEQQKIADCLSSVDDIITTESVKFKELKDHKKGLMQQLFPAEGESVPNVRFSEFLDDGEWGAEELKDACQMQAGKFVRASDIHKHNTGELFPCYGGNGLRGYTKTYTHEGKYALIGRQGALCGNITFVEGKFHATEHAVVPTPKDKIDVGWLYCVLVNLNLNQYATGQAQPGLSVKNLDKIALCIPPTKDEQLKIADFLSSIDKLIAFQNRKLDSLKAHKKVLMQKLFPCVGEVEA